MQVWVLGDNSYRSVLKSASLSSSSSSVHSASASIFASAYVSAYNPDSTGIDASSHNLSAYSGLVRSLSHLSTDKICVYDGKIRSLRILLYVLIRPIIII